MKLILNNSSKLPINEELKSLVEEINILKKMDLKFLFDEEYYSNIYNLYNNKRALQPKILVVIGIGGSNLGCMAIQHAIFGEFYNENNNLKVYYADTTDTDHIKHIIDVIENCFLNGDEVILNVISKSGKTTETIANFQVFLKLIKKHRKDFYKNIVVTTDPGSSLYVYAKNNKIDILEIPTHIGGRYSVFTAVGIFPLLFMNIDINNLLAGARKSVLNGLSHDELSISRALLLLNSYNNGIKIHDLFVFSKRLYHYGYWYRQLMAESIGKEFDLGANRVNIGMTPTVSIGSVDLHSVAQLYLSDFGNRFTTFIGIKNFKHSVVVPEDSELEAIIPDLSKNSMAEIINIICQGTQVAYKKKDRPFCIIELEYLTEYEIGYLMQSNMIEIALFGSLLNIDPFDQPNVELYKTEVRNMLRQKNG